MSDMPPKSNGEKNDDAVPETIDKEVEITKPTQIELLRSDVDIVRAAQAAQKADHEILRVAYVEHGQLMAAVHASNVRIEARVELVVDQLAQIHDQLLQIMVRLDQSAAA